MRARLELGDCLEEMKRIPDGNIDLILCDLPYGLTRAEWDRKIDLEKLWVEYNRIIKDNGAILLFSVQPFTTDLINSNRKMYRYEIIWKKTMPLGFLNANRMPLKAHENIEVFYKKLPVYNPQKTILKSANKGTVRVGKQNRCSLYGNASPIDYVDDGTRYPHDVIEFSNWNGTAYGRSIKAVKHPTAKPVPLLEWLIKTYSNRGDTVLDNCMGSGSTGVACVNTKRQFVGMEINEDYFSIAEKRISEACNETGENWIISTGYNKSDRQSLREEDLIRPEDLGEADYYCALHGKTVNSVQT